MNIVLLSFINFNMIFHFHHGTRLICHFSSLQLLSSKYFSIAVILNLLISWNLIQPLILGNYFLFKICALGFNFALFTILKYRVNSIDQLRHHVILQNHKCTSKINKNFVSNLNIV